YRLVASVRATSDTRRRNRERAQAPTAPKTSRTSPIAWSENRNPTLAAQPKERMCSRLSTTGEPGLFPTAAQAWPTQEAARRSERRSVDQTAALSWNQIGPASSAFTLAADRRS